MRIAFLSSLNPTNIRNWSGTLYYIFRTLEKHHEIEWVGGELVSQVRSFRQSNFFKGSERFYPETYSEIFGKLLSERLNRMNFDLIIARDNFFVAHLKTNKPIVYIGDTTFDLFRHSMQRNETYNILAEKVENLMIHNCSRIIYSCEWAKQSAINHYGANPNKIDVVEFGANISDIPDESDILSTDASKYNLLFIGVEEKRKGVYKAYETYRLLRQAGLDCMLTIIGCNPTKVDSVDPNLCVIPFLDKSKENERKQINDILIKSHLFILPTEFDCTPIVFCEAAAYGIPTISADVGGVSQIIREGINGFLLPYDATAEDYALKIKDIFDDWEQYKRLRKTSRKEFEDRLNWTAWGEKVNRILKDTVLEYSVLN